MLNKNLILIGICLFILILINFALYLHFGYAFGGDQALYVPTAKGFYGSFFAWSTDNYSGLITSTGSVLGYFFSFDILFYGLFGIILGYIICTSIYYWIGAFGIFVLVYELTRTLNNKTAYLGGFAAAIITTFEFSSHLKTLTIGIIFIPYVVLFTYFILKNFETGKDNKLNLFGLTIAVAFLLTTGGESYIFPNLIFLVVFGTVIFLTLKRKFWVKYLKYFSFVTIFSILMNASWIITTYTFTKYVGNQYFNSGSINTLKVLSVNLVNALVGLPSNATYINAITFLSVISIAVIGLIFLYKNKARMRLEFKLSLALISLYLIFIVFAMGTDGPFGTLFYAAVKLIPYLLVFRYTLFATHYILLFVIATLFGISSVYILDAAKNTKNRFFSLFIFAIIVIILIAYVYSFDYLPISTNTKIIIPSHVFNISDYINSEIGSFSIATLPMALGWQSTDWYFGTNVYSSLIGKPTYTGTYTYYNEIFFPISTSLYYNNVGINIDSRNIIGVNVSNLFGIFGIHYIIVQGDALTKSPCEFCYISPFTFNTIYLNLNNSKNIAFVKKFGNSSVYENSNYVPLVYASDVDNIGNASTAEIFDVIGSKTFNIQNTSVYSTSIDGFYNDSSTINARRISDFSQPNITFVQNTPTKVTVRVHNATTPYYLVFRETYDPHWAAFYSNGTEVNPYDHIAVNGFANAWYMNKTGSYTVTLYYTLQTDAWIAWAVSFIALGVTVAIGVYGWMERGE